MRAFDKTLPDWRAGDALVEPSQRAAGVGHRSQQACGGQLERYIAFGPDGLDMFLELR